jgi:Rap1a immunity proteins
MRSLLLFLLCSISLCLHATTNEETQPAQHLQTGNGFVRDCADIDAQRGEITDRSLANIAVCTGYMMGLHDGISVMVAVANQSNKTAIKVPFCLPDSVTLGQEVRVVLKYVRANPEKAHMDTSVLAIKALEEAFPCSTH